MTTQADLRREFQRLLEADMLDEAEAVLEKIEPLSEAEWKEFLANAPEDDEPVTESERRAFDEIRGIIGAADRRKRAG